MKNLSLLEHTLQLYYYKNKHNIPGISVAIAKDGKLIYANGFGYADTTNRILITPKSQFRTASCGKTITAFGIIKLIEDNKLHFDDKVFGIDGILNGENYSDIVDENIYQITVKNLLQQTIGWPDIDIIGENDASYALNERIPAGIRENVKYILKQHLDFPPSTAYRYSDFNYLFLGEIISKITNKDHPDYIISEILNPIGIYNTIPGKSSKEEREENEVVYYDFNCETAPSAFDTSKIVPLSYSYNMKPMISSGGWISTPIDMIKLILAIDGIDKPEDIFSKETIEIMSTPPQNIKSKYAMGMRVDRSSWRHTGQCTWGTSALWHKIHEDNICYAITCNTLPTTNGTEEEKYEAMIAPIIEMMKLIPNTIKEFTNYPKKDLFEQYIY